jgi:histidine ammonia-lyase
MSDAPPVRPPQIAHGKPVELGGNGRIRLEDAVAVAREGQAVAFSSGVAQRLSRARAVVEENLAGGARIYGLTTGLGAAIDTPLSPDDLAAFQERAVGARAVAVGDRLATEEVRVALFARLASLARGASGLSPGFADALLAMVNTGVHPVAHRTGSLGQADLAPLAELMLPLAGGGEATFGGQVLAGPAALAAAGITVPRLDPKDGIALINASAISVGTAALAAYDMAVVIEALTLAGALSLEAFRANLSVSRNRSWRSGPRPDRRRVRPGCAPCWRGATCSSPGERAAFRILSRSGASRPCTAGP